MPEDTAMGTAIVELTVTDADQSVAELDFFITGGDPDGQFLVHASGEVSICYEAKLKSSGTILIMIFFIQ